MVMSKYLKSILFLSIICILCTSFPAFGLEQVRTDKLDILAAEVSPQPVRPGEELLVKVSVANYDDTTVNNIILDVENQFPLILRFSEKEYGVKSISNSSFRIERISSNGNVEINYNFLIDPEARTGTYHDFGELHITPSLSIRYSFTSFQIASKVYSKRCIAASLIITEYGSSIIS